MSSCQSGLSLQITHVEFVAESYKSNTDKEYWSVEAENRTDSVQRHNTMLFINRNQCLYLLLFAQCML